MRGAAAPRQPAEWDALTAQELGVLRVVRKRLGPAIFDTVPPDVLVCFVRGYRDEKDWAAATAEKLRETLAWRATPAVSAAVKLEAPPPQRSAFEAAFQAGPVGRDREGRAIIVERLGRVPPRDFCKAWPADPFISQCIYNKEAMSSLCRSLSHEGGRRVYRAIIILDLAGLGIGHGSRAFVQLVQLYVSKFTDPYPEVMESMIFINAPLAFNALWALVRPMLDSATLAKVQVFGGERQYRPAFERAGFRFDVALRDASLSWSREMARVAPCGVSPPPFVPAADRAALLTLRHNTHAAALYAAALSISRVVRGRAQRKRTAELLRLRRLCCPPSKTTMPGKASGSVVSAAAGSVGAAAAGALRRRRPSRPRALSPGAADKLPSPPPPTSAATVRLRRPYFLTRTSPSPSVSVLDGDEAEATVTAIEVSASPTSVVDVGVARPLGRGAPPRTATVVAALLL